MLHQNGTHALIVNRVLISLNFIVGALSFQLQDHFLQEPDWHFHHRHDGEVHPEVQDHALNQEEGYPNPGSQNEQHITDAQVHNTDEARNFV